MSEPEQRARAMSIKDEYLMVWDHVNRLMGRRQSMTTIHLSVNAAIIGATAYILKGKVSFVGWQLLAMLLLLLTGMAASYMWTRLVAHYSTLLDWWYSTLRELERYAILRTLEHVGGSTSKAAKILGISPRKIQYRLNEYRSTPQSGVPAVVKES